MKQPPVRPSVVQLCQNEQMELVFKLTQTVYVWLLLFIKPTWKTITRIMHVKAWETAVINREHTLSAWETTLQVKDVALAKKAAEVTAWQDRVAQSQRAVEHVITY